MLRNFKIISCVIFIILAMNIYAKQISKIPEASGICYLAKSDSLIVVNDEGTIYEINKNGKIKRKVYLGKYDLEGITYDQKKDKLYTAVEGSESILVLNSKSLKIEKEIKLKRKYKGINLLKKSKKTGLEAIAIDKNGDIYVSNQSKILYKKKIKDNASVIIKIDSLNKNKAKIIEVYNHGYIDISGMTFYDGYLYMISDKKNLLIKYDLSRNKTIKNVKLPKSAQEGICFDDKGNIYIADDNGRILRYKRNRFDI